MRKTYTAIAATLALTFPAAAGSVKSHCEADTVVVRERVVERPSFRTYYTGAYEMPVVSALPGSSQPAIIYPTGPYPQGARINGAFMRQPVFIPL